MADPFLELNADRWQRLMSALGLPGALDMFQILEHAWSERHRRYHTLQHLSHCLTELDQYTASREPMPKVELALWFHDAIYKTLRKDNEQRSADMARRFLVKYKADRELIDWVDKAILATMHDAPICDEQIQVLVDIDLSILGASPEYYQQFEDNVRKEYWWVPKSAYVKARKEILLSFLKRPAIYGVPYFNARYESVARQNIKLTVELL